MIATKSDMVNMKRMIGTYKSELTWTIQTRMYAWKIEDDSIVKM